MALQLLVENAVKHNVASRKKPKSLRSGWTGEKEAFPS